MVFRVMIIMTVTGLFISIPLDTTAREIETVWTQSFGWTNQDECGTSVIQADNGNIAFAGWVRNLDSLDYDFYIGLCSDNGVYINEYQHGNEFNDEVAAAIAYSQDRNAFVLAGWSQDTGDSDFYAIMVDENLPGSPLMEAIGWGNDQHNEIYGIENDTPSGFLIVGRLKPTPPSEGEDGDVYIAHLDNSLNVENFECTYGGPLYDRGVDIKKCADGDFIVASLYKAPLRDAQDQLYLQRVPSDYSDCSGPDSGIYGDSNPNTGYVPLAVKETSDGNYIIVGKTSNPGSGTDWDAFILKLDSSNWQVLNGPVVMGGTGADEFNGVVENSDGGFIAVGAYHQPEGDVDMWIVEFNSTLGDPIERTEGDTGHDALFDIESLSVTDEFAVTGCITEGDGSKAAVIMKLAWTSTPVQVISFFATVDNSVVNIEWECQIQSEDTEFLLKCLRDQDVWDVPFEEISPHRYSASDSKPAIHGTGEYEYTLFGKESNQEWVVLRSQTVFVDYIPRPSQIASLYPNPFNPYVTIRYEIQSIGAAKLTVTDVAGREIKILRTGQHQAGNNEASWDGKDSQGRDVASGIYMVSLETFGNLDSKKIVLLR